MPPHWRILDNRDLLTELKNTLKEFIENSNQSHHWRELTGEYHLLHRALRSAVNNALTTSELVAVPLVSCWSLIKDARLGDRIEEYFRRQRDESINIDRLVKNSAALVATARCALVARQVAADPKIDLNQLMTWAERAARLLPDSNRSELSEDRKPLYESSAPAALVDQALVDLRRRGIHSAAAFYWTLYWLKQHIALECHNREIPVAAAYSRGGKGELARLELAQLFD